MGGASWIRGQITTDRDGFAEARLTGTSGPDCSDGQARLAASYDACPGQGDVSIEKLGIGGCPIFPERPLAPR
ncbi:MAG: hypothetical protein MZV70_00925 [Desulfobacterales bacterium]|nr:hypothetical protein [Desulfobacterales bacterium]